MVGNAERRSLPAARHRSNLAWSRSALRWCAVAPLPLVLTACDWAVLDPRGPVGQADRAILIDSLAIMLAIVVPTILAIVAFAWWFRASNTRARYRPDWEFSGAIELVVWSIPCMVIILLGGVAWIGSYAIDPCPARRGAPVVDRGTKPLEIQVVSLDWKWLFIYPGPGRRERQRARRPRRRAAALLAHLGERVNTFFVPQLGSMIYTMNGMAHPALPACRRARHLSRACRPISAATASPTCTSRCARCGIDEFTAWSRSTRAAGPTLDAVGYAALARQGTVPPSTYGSVAPGLFEQVVTQQIPPGPGPTTERGAAAEKSAK